MRPWTRYGVAVPKTADYQMYCPIARALDVVGDRWTLLIMRELTIGDQRFTDLRTNLPGIPPNLLSHRLKELTENGLVTTKELPPPAARTVYTVTEQGRSVTPVLRSLIRFGTTFLEPPDKQTPTRPETTIVTAIRAFYDREAAGDLDQYYVIEIDGKPFDLYTTPGESGARPGRKPDLVLSSAAWVLLDVRVGAMTLDEAIEAGFVTRHGSVRATRNFQKVFQLA